MSQPIIHQIRHLQANWPPETFAIELVSGRIIQVYDPRTVVTSEEGSVGILHSDGVFELIAATQIVSVSAGVHPKEKERREKWRAETEKRFKAAE